MSQVTPDNNAFEKMAEKSVPIALKTAELMVERAKEAPPIGSPRDTGHNADSISLRQSDHGSWEVHTESGYGGWLEIGTAKMPARPYFAPAFAFAVDEVERLGYRADD